MLIIMKGYKKHLCVQLVLILSPSLLLSAQLIVTVSPQQTSQKIPCQSNSVWYCDSNCLFSGDELTAAAMKILNLPQFIVSCVSEDFRKTEPPSSFCITIIPRSKILSTVLGQGHC